MKYLSLYYIIISFVILSCNGQTSKNIQTISAEAFAKKIESTPKAQLLDVRTLEEFKSEHIDNAKNINWLGTSFEADAQKLDKSKPVFVYCKSGGRSKKAAAKLDLQLSTN